MDVTNDFYGAKNPDVDHVVFVHGSVDPWHQVGIYESDLNADAPAIYIEGSSHCADMYEDGDSGVPQSPQLTDARAEIRWVPNQHLCINAQPTFRVKFCAKNKKATFI